MSKHILITGSTDGIGKIAALQLAREGHHVYLHGRNPEKLNATVSTLKSTSENDNIHGFEADFSNLKSVMTMAQAVSERLPKLDVLINNAGVYNSKDRNNAEGLDMRFVVNYFAPYLLTRELMPLLNQGENPRLINLSSAAQSSVIWAALQGKSSLSPSESYAQSKLALTMWSFWLGKQQKEVSVIAVNLGSLLNTKMVQEAYGHHWSSADKGANILHDLAVSYELMVFQQRILIMTRAKHEGIYPRLTQMFMTIRKSKPF